MVYRWLFELSDTISIFNLFRYITFRGFLSFFTAFILCMFVGPYFIRRMKKIKMGELINEDAPDSHVKKKGTPTMGGALVLSGIFLSLVFWVDMYEPLVLGSLSIVLGFALIGFCDDWIKVKHLNVKGLSRSSRLFFEFLVSIFVLSILLYFDVINTSLYFPFFKNMVFDLGWGYVFFGSLVIVGFANAVNLTDGLDGLASFPIVVCALTMAVFSYLGGHASLSAYLGIPFVPGAGELAPFSMAIGAASLAFLWYNTYPAQIFMGDMGSLSLGGFLGVVAVLTKNELIMPILGGVFMIEVFSVISQVFAFQLRGKRIFSMAPLHHHYELKGMNESKIIVRFWIISLLFSLLSLATLKLR